MKDMKSKSNIISKILNTLLNISLIIFGIILLVSIYTGVQTKILKNKYSDFFGYSIFEVQTGSMAETINAGDWILVKLTKNIKLNDIITYELNGNYITHRVIELRRTTYITRGDANTTNDNPIDQSQVVGKVVRTFRNLGFLRKTLFNKTVLIAIIVTLFFFNLAFKNSKPKSEAKEKTVEKENIKQEKLIKILAFFKPLIKKIVVLWKKLVRVLKRVIRKIASNVKKLLKRKPLIEKVKTEETPVNNNSNISENIVVSKDIDEEDDYYDIPSDNSVGDLDKTSIFRIISIESDDAINQKLKVIDEHKKAEKAKDAIVDFIEVDSKFINSNIEDYVDDELEKTSIYRVISIDEDDVDDKYKKLLNKKNDSEEEEMRYIAVDSDEVNDTLLEIAQNTIKESPSLPIQEKKIEVKVEKEEEIDSGLTDINLSLLKDKIGINKGKTIIDTAMILKSEELTEIISILTEDSKINNKKYNEKFIEAYNDAKYYNMLKDEVSANASQFNKIKKAIERAGIEIKTDKKFNTKDSDLLEKYISMMLVIANLEKANMMVSDIKVKVEFYKNELLKLAKKFTVEKMEDKVSRIMRVQKESRNMLELFLKELNTNMFELKFNPLKNIKNMHGIELMHNLSFSKVYSDYIIDKTYSEGIVAEDKLYILLNLLLVRLVTDMYTDDFNKKYLLYFPKTLFSKSKKFEKILRIFDNKYSKENIYILINYSSLIKGNSIIKKARKQGYKFALIFDKNALLLEKDRGDIYVFDYVFVDKQDERLNEIVDFIPEDFSNNIIYEDISDKVGDCRGEEE